MNYKELLEHCEQAIKNDPKFPVVMLTLPKNNGEHYLKMFKNTGVTCESIYSILDNSFIAIFDAYKIKKWLFKNHFA